MKKAVVGILVVFLLMTHVVLTQEKRVNFDQQSPKIAKGKLIASPPVLRYKPLLPSSVAKTSRSQIASRTRSAKAQSVSPSVVSVWSWTFDEPSPGEGWTLTGLWQIGIPTFGPSASTNVAGTNLSGNYDNSADYWLITPGIELPSSSANTSAALRFKEWYQLESGCDFGHVMVSTDGGINYTEVSIRDGSSDWRETEIDLTSYLSQTIKLAFRLTTDASVTYPGWYFDDVEVLAVPKKNLTADLTTLNYSAFPFIYLNVNVDSVGIPLPSLTAASFKVYQDGIEQDDYFSVTPPSSGGGVRLADIVFVVDQTGSMGEEISSVKTNMVSFLDALASSGINYRVGFVIFGDITQTLNAGNLYSDYAEILNTINSINIGMIDGGGDYQENQLEAMYQATQMNFRAGAQRTEIMITDAAAHAGDYETSWTVESLIPVLAANNMAVYPIFDVSMTDQMGQYQPIAQARNSAGVYYNVYDNFNTIISDIGTTIGETYVVRFASSDRRTSGVRHLVEVEVSHAGYTDSDTASYMFGAAPFITRTSETAALGATALAEHSEVSIHAYVTDSFEPFVSSATLYYRRTGTSSFTSVPMANAHDSLFQASVPVDLVLTPGVDYYITASDGIDVASDPREEPGTNPYQIAVLPNVAPVITHIPVSFLSPGIPIVISASVLDNTNSLSSVNCYYRKTGALLYTSIDMVLVGGSTYTATIPGDFTTADGVDYYLTATDDFGLRTFDGRPTHPHQVTLPAGPAGQTILTGTAFLNDSLAPAGSIIRTYKNTSLSLVSIDTVVPYVGGKNYAISILMGDGGAYDGDSLTFRLEGPTGEIGLECGHPLQRFVNGVPPQFVETDLRFSGQRSLTIPLVQGYNAVSWNVRPPSLSLADIFSPLFERSNVQVILEYVNDGISAPRFDFYIPALGPYNPIQQAEDKKGYFIRLRKGSPRDSLTISGPRLYHGSPITLRPGYNLVGYLPFGPDVVSHAISGLRAGAINSVLAYRNSGVDSSGSEFFDIWPLSVTFTEMQPGKGYFVQATDSVQLSYPLSGSGSPTPALSRISSLELGSGKSFSLPQAIFAYGLHVTYKGNIVAKGSVLRAHNKEGVLCGEAVFAADGVVGIAIRGNGVNGGEGDGASPGELVSLSLNENPVPFKVKWTESGDTPLLASLTTSVAVDASSLPTKLILRQNYPNPFNPTTEIQYDLPRDVSVQLKVFNLVGQEVCTLVSQEQLAGRYRVVWNGSGSNGAHVPSGVYICRLIAGDHTQTLKMMLLK
jgi:hypothetical protein